MLLKTLFILLNLLILNLSQAAECPPGTQTRLQYSLNNASTIARLDQSIGQTQFVLTSNSTGQVLWTKTYEGRWFCLGFNQRTKTYLLGGIFQVGAWLPLAAIDYLQEKNNRLTSSVFSQQNYLAYATAVSPKSRYIAFIGGQQKTGELYLLDTEKDRIKKLGLAPAPPPVADSFSSEEPFTWGTGWADGYLSIEPSVLRFKTETILQVSYGKDTPQGRAKKRKVRYFSVAGKKRF